jgi:hypothetical protein
LIRTARHTAAAAAAPARSGGRRRRAPADLPAPAFVAEGADDARRRAPVPPHRDGIAAAMARVVRQLRCCGGWCVGDDVTVWSEDGRMVKLRLPSAPPARPIDYYCVLLDASREGRG